MPGSVSKFIQKTRLELQEGDITALATDAIVNPANTQLVLGGGVAGAIARKGGPEIQAECERLGPIEVGQAAMTAGGRLAARYVIHAVGPRWGEGDEDAKLSAATRSALELAEERGLGSVGLPAISTGIFGFPMDRCAEIMLGTIVAFLAAGAKLDHVVICLFGDEAFATFAAELERLLAGGCER